ncbi:hypothetical protein B0H11DRAFT_2418663 [Mycena galericulata]|nr:hypothetical protein B0H11DRAFT_2418663 [Mycena galericulata]
MQLKTFHLPILACIFALCLVEVRPVLALYFPARPSETLPSTLVNFFQQYRYGTPEAAILYTTDAAERSQDVRQKVAEIEERIRTIVRGATAIHEELHALHKLRLQRESNRDVPEFQTEAVSLDDIAGDLQRVFEKVLEELKDMFPAPDHAQGHDERQAAVAVALEKAGAALVTVCAKYGMDEERARAHWDGVVRPAIHTTVVLIGDLVEHHPDLLGSVLFFGAVMLIPNYWLLRPVLSLFGFGPTGPVKGSTAAWAQRVFYGASVSKGSWFALLDKVIDKVPGITTLDQGDRIQCTPMSIPDILYFFLGNYIAHAVTVRSYPGESASRILLSFAAALFFPFSGLFRGLNSFARHAIVTKDPLERAARSGALCMVVRNEKWKPTHSFRASGVRLATIRLIKVRVPVHGVRGKDGAALPASFRKFFERLNLKMKKAIDKVVEVLQKLEFTGRIRLDTFLKTCLRKSEGILKWSLHSWGVYAVNPPLELIYGAEVYPRPVMKEHELPLSHLGVQGVNRLPEGYSFAFVPYNAKVVALVNDVDPVVSSGYSIPKAAIGALQIVYASFTLYRSRGGQIQQYGYAAYALTVLPYAIMTLINIVGSFLTPEYAALHLVQSDVLLEAQERSGTFFGVVGKLVTVTEEQRVASSTEDPCSGSFEVGADGATRFVWDRPAAAVSSAESGIPWPQRSLVDGANELVDSHVQNDTTARTAVIITPAASHTPSPDSTPVYLQIPACSKLERHEKRTQVSLPLVVASLALMGAILVTLWGVLSNWFSPGASTPFQRGFISAWVIVGGLVGPLSVLLPYLGPKIFTEIPPLDESNAGATATSFGYTTRALILIFTYCAPAIGGFVVVGLMLREHGNCV